MRCILCLLTRLKAAPETVTSSRDFEEKDADLTIWEPGGMKREKWKMRGAGKLVDCVHVIIQLASLFDEMTY